MTETPAKLSDAILESFLHDLGLKMPLTTAAIRDHIAAITADNERLTNERNEVIGTFETISSENERLAKKLSSANRNLNQILGDECPDDLLAATAAAAAMAVGHKAESERLAKELADALAGYRIELGDDCPEKLVDAVLVAHNRHLREQRELEAELAEANRWRWNYENAADHLARMANCFSDHLDAKREYAAELEGKLHGCATMPATIKRLESELATAQSELAALRDSQLHIARTYDPNCDVFVEADEIEKMKAARQSIEALQELANYLGRDPEGCLTDVPDEAMGKLEELAALQSRLDALAETLGDDTVEEFARAYWDARNPRFPWSTQNAVLKADVQAAMRPAYARVAAHVRACCEREAAERESELRNDLVSTGELLGAASRETKELRQELADKTAELERLRSALTENDELYVSLVEGLSEISDGAKDGNETIAASVVWASKRLKAIQSTLGFTADHFLDATKMVEPAKPEPKQPAEQPEWTGESPFCSYCGRPLNVCNLTCDGWKNLKQKQTERRFECPKCGNDDYRTWPLASGNLHCSNRNCDWIGTWAEVAAAQAKEVKITNVYAPPGLIAAGERLMASKAAESRAKEPAPASESEEERFWLIRHIETMRIPYVYPTEEAARQFVTGVPYPGSHEMIPVVHKSVLDAATSRTEAENQRAEQAEARVKELESEINRALDVLCEEDDFNSQFGLLQLADVTRATIGGISERLDAANAELERLRAVLTKPALRPSTEQPLGDIGYESLVQGLKILDNPGTQRASSINRWAANCLRAINVELSKLGQPQAAVK